MESDFKAIYKYVGKEKYVMGVPRRDLTEDEWEALTPLEKRVAKGLYKKVTPARGAGQRDTEHNSK